VGCGPETEQLEIETVGQEKGRLKTGKVTTFFLS
jgi:hypothetical protein